MGNFLYLTTRVTSAKVPEFDMLGCQTPAGMPVIASSWQVYSEMPEKLVQLLGEHTNVFHVDVLSFFSFGM